MQNILGSLRNQFGQGLVRKGNISASYPPGSAGSGGRLALEMGRTCPECTCLVF